MAVITLTIPNAITSRVIDAITIKFGYEAIINGLPNPQTKADFVKAWIITQIKNAVKQHESELAATTALLNAQSDVETNITIT